VPDGVERDVLRVGPTLSIPLAEIAFRYETSGGAGGQHANRSHTRVELSFDAGTSPSLSAEQRERIVTELGRVVGAGAADSRSQSRNRDLALDRLARKLRDALHVDPPRRPTRPSKASIRRRLDAKRKVGERKQLRKPPTTD
jgi:ribosome-associated protein